MIHTVYAQFLFLALTLSSFAQSVDTITQIHLSGEAIVLGLLGIIGFFARGKMKAYDKHLETCHDKAVTLAATEEKLANVERRAEQMSTTIQWVGDCMIKVGSKLDVDLPDRPYSTNRS